MLCSSIRSKQHGWAQIIETFSGQQMCESSFCGLLAGISAFSLLCANYLCFSSPYSPFSPAYPTIPSHFSFSPGQTKPAWMISCREQSSAVPYVSTWSLACKAIPVHPPLFHDDTIPATSVIACFWWKSWSMAKWEVGQFCSVHLTGFAFRLYMLPKCVPAQ
jgi:hypothetical protein